MNQPKTSSESFDRPAWIDAAERLRAIRRACALFLDRWAKGHLDKGETGIERMEADLAADDSDDHDWPLLYRGSGLDD